MPIDPTEASAPPTTRRSFLARAAFGGALVSAVATADPLRLLTAGAGAQSADLESAPDMDDATFAVLGTSVELAAVQAYQAALATDLLDTEWTETATSFQDHHQTVADFYAEKLPEGAAAPQADSSVADPALEAIRAASDQKGLLTALAQVEETLAATGLYAIGGLTDLFFAKAVGQIMAVESQQAVVLGRAVGTDIAELTPAQASTEGAVTNFSEAADAATTTTEATSTTEKSGS